MNEKKEKRSLVKRVKTKGPPPQIHAYTIKEADIL